MTRPASSAPESGGSLYIITAKKRGRTLLVLTKNGHVSHTNGEGVYKIIPPSVEPPPVVHTTYDAKSGKVEVVAEPAATEPAALLVAEMREHFGPDGSGVHVSDSHVHAMLAKINALTASLDAMRVERDGLKADKDRLDWLEAFTDNHKNDGDARDIAVDAGFRGTYYSNVRQAIDAARTALRSPEAGTLTTKDANHA